MQYMTQINQMSFATCKINLFCRANKIGSASGFFYESKGRKFLVSNWHVFSGRDAVTNETIHKSKTALPDEIEIVYASVLSLDESTGLINVAPHQIKCKIKNVDLKANWIELPNYDPKVDIAALSVSFMDGLKKPFMLTDMNLNNELEATIGGDVFIVGFPLGLANNEFLPIWKRGSIASEPSVPFNREPLFLIDSATREGLSGSPVYLTSDGNSPDAQGNVILGRARQYKFLGIYSGRVHDKDIFAAQIGRVFHAELLVTLTESGVFGSYPD
jgi:Trypsin-like peptidase domain